LTIEDVESSNGTLVWIYFVVIFFYKTGGYFYGGTDFGALELVI
jgi:hypothetical protein